VPYHVKIRSEDRGQNRRGALALDKDADWIEEHIAAPRRQGRDIFVDGQVFSWDSIGEIHITQTEQTSAQLVPRVRARLSDSALVTARPDEWFVPDEGQDVTEQFLTGPPGTGPRADPRGATTFAANRKAVMVIYGHDTQANTALFDWLRAIGLQPQEWSQLIQASALQDVQAVVAFFTPDEYVTAATTTPAGQGTGRPQARPNVLIEAGMALITHPKRTVLAVLGNQELPSDLSGRHYIRLSHTNAAPLHDLAARLHDAGCDTDTSGTDWLNPARFPDRDHTPQARHEDNTPAPGPAPARAKQDTLAGPRHPPASRPCRLARTLTGHTSDVNAVAFSSDSRLLATGDSEGTVRIWDPATGDHVRALTGHTSRVYEVAFSPDGSMLATASSAKTVRIWDPATGNLAHALTGHITRVYGVAFSPDGTLLATAGGDKTALIWDLATGGLVHTLGGHKAEVYSVAFSPDGTLLATASGDHTARIWDLATGGQLHSLNGHKAEVYSVAFSSDGTLLATAGGDKTALIWDLATGGLVHTLGGHKAEVNWVAFSPDGTLLATASGDKTARLWNPANGNQLYTLRRHTAGVYSVAFSPDGTLLATASGDKTARIWS
jgi:DNA-binding beta-propeller fold protein YncE